MKNSIKEKQFMKKVLNLDENLKDDMCEKMRLAFIEEGNRVHNFKYDYSKVEFDKEDLLNWLTDPWCCGFIKKYMAKIN